MSYARCSVCGTSNYDCELEACRRCDPEAFASRPEALPELANELALLSLAHGRSAIGAQSSSDVPKGPDGKRITVTSTPPTGMTGGRSKDVSLEELEKLLAEVATRAYSVTRGADPELGSQAETLVGLELATKFRELRWATWLAKAIMISRDPGSVTIGFTQSYERNGAFYRLAPTHAASDLSWTDSINWEGDALVAALWRARKTHMIEIGRTGNRVRGGQSECMNPACGKIHRSLARLWPGQWTDPRRAQLPLRGCPHCGHLVSRDVVREDTVLDVFSPARGGRKLTKAYLRRRFNLSRQRLRRILRTLPAEDLASSST